MPSPFPGMDPFIESQLWPDFHGEFVTGLRAALLPVLRPRYLALVEERVYVEHTPDEPVRSMRPDVTVAQDRSEARGAGAATVMAPVTVPIAMPERVREPRLVIRLRDTHEIVTIIEVLSPANKRPHGDGRRECLSKRDVVLESASHLVEIDLLRGGDRLPMARPLPPGDYFVVVSRAPRRPLADVWPFTLQHRLPSIGVPLVDGDSDAPVDLQAVLDAVYDRAGYDYQVDYRRPVEPPLPQERLSWAEALLGGH